MPKKTENRKHSAKKSEPEKSKIIVKKKVLQPLIGMKDILPAEQPYWQLARNKATQLVRDYDFQRIDIPIAESTELFTKVIGKTTSLVSDKLFSFTDRDSHNSCLRPGAITSLARAYLQYNWLELPKPIKLFYSGPVFLYQDVKDNTQRQFYRLGFEVLGEKHPVVDAELILIAFNFYRELDVPITVQINSLGCNECRTEYKKKLIEHYRNKKNLLCPVCKETFTKNPLSILTCSEEKCVSLREDAPQIVDWLCEECKEHFIKVLEYLDELEVPYILNQFLIQEANYCTKTIFEIWPEGSEGSKKSLASGGRHDDFISALAEEPETASGFTINLEKTVARLKESNVARLNLNKSDVFLAQLGEAARRKALVLFEELKSKDIRVSACFAKDSLKSQLEMAVSSGVKIALILGQKEVLDGTILIRDMEGGIQEIVDFEKALVEVQKRLI